MCWGTIFLWRVFSALSKEFIFHLENSNIWFWNFFPDSFLRVSCRRYCNWKPTWPSLWGRQSPGWQGSFPCQCCWRAGAPWPWPAWCWNWSGLCSHQRRRGYSAPQTGGSILFNYFLNPRVLDLYLGIFFYYYYYPDLIEVGEVMIVL